MFVHKAAHFSSPDEHGPGKLLIKSGRMPSNLAEFHELHITLTFCSDPNQRTMITLTIANRLMSMRGRIDIRDERDAIVYHARGEFAVVAPTWRVYRGEHAEGEPIALIRRKLWTWAPTWNVRLDGGDFHLKRKLWSWRRIYRTFGGDYDGAQISGNIWDMSFAIRHKGSTLATAAGKLLSLRDRHRVEIAGVGEEFVVVAMVVVQIDRQADSARSGSN